MDAANNTPDYFVIGNPTLGDAEPVLTLSPELLHEMAWLFDHTRDERKVPDQMVEVAAALAKARIRGLVAVPISRDPATAAGQEQRSDA